MGKTVINDKSAILWLLAKKYKLPMQVIAVIINSPFLFMTERMADLDDTRDIYFPYFGKFKIKTSIRNKLEGKVYEKSES